MNKVSLSIVTVCVLGFFGCSELKNENPAPISSSVGVHPEGMASPSSANFHGTVIAANNGNTKECTKCHGADYNGGTSKKSCNACHKHPDGVLTPSSANFHGKAIAAKNWDMSSCKTCHGATYAGGMSGKSCLTCHSKANGPENCTVCHGSGTSAAPPKDVAGSSSPASRGVGAHQVHLNGGGSLGAISLKCTNCHVVPSALASAGHLDATPYASVRFDSTGNLAFMKTNVVGTGNYTSTLPTVVPVPSYATATIKCSGTYCHGTFKNGNPSTAIAWNDTTAAAIACGTCHGDVTKATLAERALPKTSANGGTHFAMTGCSGCHADVVDANLKIIAPSKHVNGKLNVFGSEIAY